MIKEHRRVILTSDLATELFYVPSCSWDCETCTLFVLLTKLEI